MLLSFSKILGSRNQPLSADTPNTMQQFRLVSTPPGTLGIWESAPGSRLEQSNRPDQQRAEQLNRSRHHCHCRLLATSLSWLLQGADWEAGMHL
jgi:hypothetical protein